jgi:hypothetical protein
MEDYVDDAGSVDEPSEIEEEEINEIEEEDQDETEASDSEDSSEKKEKKPAPRSNPESSKKSVQKAKEGEKAQEEPAPQKLTASEVEDISRKLNLPKEIKPFLNKEGDLRFIVPIDGKKYVATTEEIFKGFNLNQAGHKRLQEGKDLQAQIRGYFDQIKKDPNKIWDIADKLGHDKYSLAESLLKGYVDEAGMSPEEKEQRRVIEEAEALRAENERFKKEKADKEYQDSVAQHRNQLGQELVQAMTEHGFKPFSPNEDPAEKRTKSSIMASAIGKHLLAHQHKKNLSIADAVYLAKQEWKDNVLSVFDDIDDHHIVDLIPERIVKAIRKADVARLRGETPSSSYGQKLELQEFQEERRPKRTKKKLGIADYFSSI